MRASTVLVKAYGGAQIGSGFVLFRDHAFVFLSVSYFLLSSQIEFLNKITILNNVVHITRAYPSFRSMKPIRSIATPPGWDASPSQVTLQHFIRVALTVRRYPFIPRLERHCESKVSCPRTHGDTKISRKGNSTLTAFTVSIVFLPALTASPSTSPGIQQREKVLRERKYYDNRE